MSRRRRRHTRNRAIGIILAQSWIADTICFFAFPFMIRHSHLRLGRNTKKPRRVCQHAPRAVAAHYEVGGHRGKKCDRKPEKNGERRSRLKSGIWNLRKIHECERLFSRLLEKSCCRLIDAASAAAVGASASGCRHLYKGSAGNSAARPLESTSEGRIRRRENGQGSA